MCKLCITRLIRAMLSSIFLCSAVALPFNFHLNRWYGTMLSCSTHALFFFFLFVLYDDLLVGGT